MILSPRVRVGLILFFFLFFFSLKYFNLGAHAELFNPYISTETQESPTVLSADSTASDIPVSCVLSYGTFFVSQQDCDVLVSFEENTHNASTQCVIPDGTFLVSESECIILRRAQGSQDIMQRVD